MKHYSQILGSSVQSEHIRLTKKLLEHKTAGKTVLEYPLFTYIGTQQWLEKQGYTVERNNGVFPGFKISWKLD